MKHATQTAPESSTFDFNCPSCGRLIKGIHTSYIGSKAHCKKCKQPITVPSPAKEDENDQPEQEAVIKEEHAKPQVILVEQPIKEEIAMKPPRLSIKYPLIASVVFSLVGFWLGSTFNRPPYPLPGEDGLYEVRQWLKLHLDDPHWEEMRYWPTRRIPEITTEALHKATKDLEGYKKNELGSDPEHNKSMIEYTEKRIRKLQKSPSPSMCRLQFRTKNRQGGMEIRDYVWGFSDMHGFTDEGGYLRLATDTSFLDLSIYEDQDEKSRELRKQRLEQDHNHLRSRFPEYELPRISMTNR